MNLFQLKQFCEFCFGFCFMCGIWYFWRACVCVCMWFVYRYSFYFPIFVTLFCNGSVRQTIISIGKRYRVEKEEEKKMFRLAWFVLIYFFFCVFFSLGFWRCKYLFCKWMACNANLQQTKNGCKIGLGPPTAHSTGQSQSQIVPRANRKKRPNSINIIYCFIWFPFFDACHFDTKSINLPLSLIRKCYLLELFNYYYRKVNSTTWLQTNGVELLVICCLFLLLWYRTKSKKKTKAEQKLKEQTNKTRIF